MEAAVFLRPLGFAALAFALLLLVVPVAQVVRGVKPWKALIGLWIAGWGFLLIGLGLALADRGWGPAVLPGVIATVVGHFAQRRQASRSEG